MIQFPLFQLIDEWVKSHRTEYVAWFLVTGLLVGGGLGLLKEDIQTGVFLLISGMGVWIVGAVFLALTGGTKKKNGNKD